ncbi:MAG: PilT/PilU family type 4a pilus ATPase, partial [Planctomycetota bacterium]
AKRMKAELDMHYWKREDDSSRRAVRTVDISLGSLLFEETELIPIGTKVEVEVEFPAFEARITASGWINKIKAKKRGGAYHYCVLFEEISKTHSAIINEYIEVIDVNRILDLAVEKNSSDVHVMAGHPPVFRDKGELVALDQPALSPSDLKFMILSMMTDKQRRLFETQHELNFSYIIPGGHRFRVNVHLDRGNVEASIRTIPSEIKPLPELGLPDEVAGFADRKKGLVLITGPMGSGKTTTITSLVDAVNQNRKCMIVGIEDPIEYVHNSKMSFVKQREVGVDTLSFTEGLKNALRQDPNVIFISELKDRETIALAMMAAETGLLVLATMNTSGIVDCVEKLVDLFPSDQHEQARARLASCIEGVSSQFLLPRKDGNGRVVACEVMSMTSTLRKLIREGKMGRNSQFIEAGFTTGIRDLDDSLKALVEQGLIDHEVAKSYARKPESFKLAAATGKIAL